MHMLDPSACMIALRKSDEFWNANSQKDGGKGKRNFLTVFVVVGMVAQVVKFCHRLASMIAVPILLDRMTACDTKFGASENVITNVLEEKRCNWFMKLTSYKSVYLKTKIDSAFEILAGVALMTRKKCAS